MSLAMDVHSGLAWIPKPMQIILVIYISSLGCVANSSFVSTPAHVNGVLTTCVREQISFTCSHNNDDSPNTVWRFSPPPNCLLRVDHVDTSVIGECDLFTIQNISSGDLPPFTSTAVTTAATSLTGTVARCDDGGGALASQVGSNISICVVAQPTNLVIDGSRLSWSGTSCSGSSVTYEVAVRGPQTMVFNVSSGTSTTLNGLEPNQNYSVGVRAFGSSCSTQSAGTSFMASPIASGGSTTTSTSSASTTTDQSSRGGDRDSGTAVGLGIAIPLLLVCVVAAVGVPVVYYFMFYKRNSKPSEPVLMEEQASTSLDHKYEEIKPKKRKFLDIFKFKKEQELEPLSFPPPSLPPPRPNEEGLTPQQNSNDKTSVPPEGTSVDPVVDEGRYETKKELVTNIGGYDEIDDIPDPKSSEGNEDTRTAGSSVDKKKPVKTIGGYDEIDDFPDPKSSEECGKTGADIAKPSAKNQPPTSERAKVALDPNELPFPGRMYSDVDKLQKVKDRRKKAATGIEEDPEAPTLPARSPSTDGVTEKSALGQESTDDNQPATPKPNESVSRPPSLAPEKPPRSNTNTASAPEKPKRASKAGSDLDASKQQQPISASDGGQNEASSEAPPKPPRSNTNTAPEKPKRSSKVADNSEQSPSQQTT